MNALTRIVPLKTRASTRVSCSGCSSEVPDLGGGLTPKVKDMVTTKIDTQNSGRMKLLRHSVRFATKNSPQEQTMKAFADLFVKSAAQLGTPAGGSAPVGDLYEELHKRLSFLGVPKEELIGTLVSMANDDDALYAENLLIDGQSAGVLLKKNDIRGANSRNVLKEGFSRSGVHLVSRASLGMNMIPYAFQRTTGRNLQKLLEPSAKGERNIHLPAPVVATMGQCECCVAGHFRQMIDALVKLTDLPLGSVEKLVKKAPSAGISEFSARELLEEIQTGDTLTQQMIMSYMMNFDSSHLSDSLLIPVVSLRLSQSVTGKKKKKVELRKDWTISWQCTECLRDFFMPQSEGDVRARMNTNTRLADLRNMISKDHVKKINQMWSEQHKAARQKAVNDVLDQQNDNLSKGRTRGGASHADPHVVADVLERFVEAFGDKSDEVKEHLFYAKNRGKSFPTRWGIKKSTTFAKVRKKLLDREKEMEKIADEESAVLDVVDELLAGLAIGDVGVKGGEE